MAYPSIQLRMREGYGKLITFPEDQREELKKFLESKKNSSSSKEAMIKHVIGGKCCIRRELPTMQVVYSLERSTKIERYCDKCIKNVFAREAVL